MIALAIVEGVIFSIIPLTLLFIYFTYLIDIYKVKPLRLVSLQNTFIWLKNQEICNNLNFSLCCSNILPTHSHSRHAPAAAAAAATATATAIDADLRFSSSPSESTLKLLKFEKLTKNYTQTTFIVVAHSFLLLSTITTNIDSLREPGYFLTYLPMSTNDKQQQEINYFWFSLVAVFTIVSQLYCGDDDKSIVLNALSPSGTIAESFIAHHSNEKRPSGDIKISKQICFLCQNSKGLTTFIKTNFNPIIRLYLEGYSNSIISFVTSRSLPSSLKTLLTTHYTFIEL
uniref:Uncharacterized protein n=1 Tax=Glossina palpalis gambiensis TaxID=67801 RepID=A0A1B0BD41_9MUSC